MEMRLSRSANDVNNRYEWSNVAPDPNGNAFTDFLAKLNDSSQPATWSSSSAGSVGTQESGCFADHCDWRLPNVAEIQTILDCEAALPASIHSSAPQRRRSTGRRPLSTEGRAHRPRRGP
jgi:hypothetical protein